jgi:hypothetical protein
MSWSFLLHENHFFTRGRVNAIQQQDAVQVVSSLLLLANVLFLAFYCNVLHCMQSYCIRKARGFWHVATCFPVPDVIFPAKVTVCYWELVSASSSSLQAFVSASYSTCLHFGSANDSTLFAASDGSLLLTAPCF